VPAAGRTQAPRAAVHPDGHDSNILFICGGTFVGIEDIIRRRLGKRRIGFRAEKSETDMLHESGEILAQALPDDVIEFGMIPELIGRLPVITPLMPLDVEAMISILTEPKNAIIRQYEYMFGLENAKLTFTESALQAIAEKAMARKTGARALRGVMEELMLQMMYDLPDLAGDGGEFVIDRDAVLNPKQLAELRVARKESA
jgi:ATP-dependent Clp protease ATP-binding subunit ClpX